MGVNAAGEQPGLLNDRGRSLFLPVRHHAHPVHALDLQKRLGGRYSSVASTRDLAKSTQEMASSP